MPGILLGYVLRYIEAEDSNTLNYTEVKHDLRTYKNIINLKTYTLYNISVAGYTRTGTGNFSEAQSWTDEGGESSFVLGSPSVKIFLYNLLCDLLSDRPKD